MSKGDQLCYYDEITSSVGVRVETFFQMEYCWRRQVYKLRNWLPPPLTVSAYRRGIAGDNFAYFQALIVKVFQFMERETKKDFAEVFVDSGL